MDELMDVTTHDLVGMDTRKNLEIFGGRSILGSRQGQTSVVPNA